MSRSVGAILENARAQAAAKKNLAALKELDRARRVFRRTESRNGLSEVLELAREIKPLSETESSRHERLLERVERDICLLPESASPESVEEARERYLAEEAKRKRPSRRTLQVYSAIGIAVIGAFAAMEVVIVGGWFTTSPPECNVSNQGWPAWAPDGKSLVYAVSKCHTHLVVIRVPSGEKVDLKNDFATQPSWSPDGKKILFRSESGYSVIPAGGGSETALIHDDRYAYFGAAWSPDGERIAFSRRLIDDLQLPTVLFISDSRGHHLKSLYTGPCNPRTPAWSPDGKRLAFACDDGVYTLRLADQKLTRIETFSAGGGSIDLDLIVPSWSPDGVSLALADFGRLEIVPADNSAGPKFLAGNRDREMTGQTSWSPDGSEIAYTLFNLSRMTIGSLYIIDRDGSHKRFLRKFGY